MYNTKELKSKGPRVLITFSNVNIDVMVQISGFTKLMMPIVAEPVVNLLWKEKKLFA